MTDHIETVKGILDTKISRRGFMAGAGGLTFAFTLGGSLLGRAADLMAAEGGSAKMNAWVTIGADNTVTVMVPGAEMGQGILTALPLILAEELDADWSTVRTQYAPPIPKIYGNYHPLFNGVMVTAASVSVPGYWMPLRLAGAQARRVLLESVAQQWKVPIAELATENGFVVHANSGKRISYGDVVKFATVPAEPPKITEADLKKPSEFRLIGREDIPRTDVPSKVNGSAKYGIDAQVEGMIYATVFESPMDGAKATNVNIPDVMKTPGVTKVVPLPFGVAVFGETVEATRAGRNALKVTWDTSGAKGAGFDSGTALAEYARHGKDPKAEAKEWFKKGDVAAALGGAKRVLEAEYSSEYCYHAQMEPMNCIAKVAPDGQSAELWVGTQSTALMAFVASQVLKTTPDKIRVHQHLLGGGYGRRLAPDVVAQAVVLSKVAQGPVKLILTREDDVLAARPRPMTYHILKAGLDGGGKLVGWQHRIVAENVDAIAVPPRFKATGGKDIIGWRGLETPFYGIPNMFADGVREIRGTRVHPWRGIGAGYNKFAGESFLDEVAVAMGVDPLVLRLELTKDAPRARAVIEAAAEMAQWNTPRPGRGMGIAFSDYHGSFSAGVAEVSVDRGTGKIKVHNYWVAVDPGIVVQPVNVHAQTESAVVYGLSAALLEELTFKDGTVEQRNFNDYPVLRMADLPEIHTRIVASGAEPSGMGEIGVPCVAPAIGNAVFQLTGKRIRALPMSPQRVKNLLA
jgi:isoquinoline 1-oxidoreductase beta subunit